MDSHHFYLSYFCSSSHQLDIDTFREIKTDFQIIKKNLDKSICRSTTKKNKDRQTKVYCKRETHNKGERRRDVDREIGGDRDNI